MTDSITLKNKTSLFSQMIEFFPSCWLGKQPLWKAYWLIGIGGLIFSVSLSLPVAILFYPHWISPLFDVALQTSIFIFWFVSVNRCAKNTNNDFLKDTALVMSKLILLLKVGSLVGVIQHGFKFLD